jgi:hypothetical protein
MAIAPSRDEDSRGFVLVPNAESGQDDFDSVFDFSFRGAIVNTQSRPAILALVAALAPGAASATLVFSDQSFTVSTRVSSQFAPSVEDRSDKVVPHDGFGGVESLSRADGEPFPNRPNTVGSAFASAAHLAAGPAGVNSGVGVNGFFLKDSLPRNALSATATHSQTITNTSATQTEPVFADIFVPAPTMHFFGVGKNFPFGNDPSRDVFADVRAELLLFVRHADGTTESVPVLTYGATTFRDALDGFELKVFPISPESTGITPFENDDGSFGFALPELNLVDVHLADIGPLESIDFNYLFSASASTGFGETGIFAAIGDPFDLSAGGGRLDIGQALGPVGAVPEPSTGILLAAGLLALAALKRAGLPGSKARAAS